MKTSIKLFIGISLVLFINIIANAQNVGIGTTSPDSSAMLDITSTNTGILIPRMTAAQRTAIPYPATGLMVYQTDGDTGFWYYDGTNWISISEVRDLVFERNGTTIRQIDNYDTDDFIIGSESLPQNGVAVTDTLLFFDKSKAAFRSGKINSKAWATDSIGFASFAFNANSKAIGDFSTAWGLGTTASGAKSTAWGQGTIASALRSTAWGNHTQASGEDATAWGTGATASSWTSTAWGAATIASGKQSTAWGVWTEALDEEATAWGYGPIASGMESTAWGTFTNASGYDATAWGEETVASGENSTAFGYQTHADTTLSTAWGNNSKATSTMSTAWGKNTLASGSKSTAWGESTIASGNRSTAWGYQTQATQYHSTAWGNNSKATSTMSTAWGKNTLASGSRSTAWGESTIAPSGYETALGEFNTEYTPSDTAGWNANDRLFVIGNGTSGTARNNALTLYKNGDLILNRDQLPQNNVTVTDTLLFFDKSKAAFRVGKINSKSWATDSIGFASFAFNNNSKAIGDYSTAWGDSTAASGDIATAWGNHTTASGIKATVWGDVATASGVIATAFGFHSKASGDGSTAWGDQSQASGIIATAWGKGTIAPSGFETALGAFNTKYTPSDTAGWNANDRLFVIGNGTSSTATNNALTLYKNGDLILNKDALPQNGVVVTDNLLFFDKSKAAFRAGELNNSAYWSPDSMGTASFAFNRNTKAIGDYSTAWGAGTSASGTKSTAFGYQTKAYGLNSTAWGIRTKAPSAFETVLGGYNTDYTANDSIGWNDNDRLFVIGNGTSNTSRHNALTMLKNGTIGIGSVTNPTYALELPEDAALAKGHGRAYAWDTYSDSRVKFSQKPINYGLDQVMKLVPKSYVQHNSTFEDGVLSISDEGKHTIGLIAQEVYKIIPEAVQKPQDESKELWSMDYEKLIPVLIKGMQQQQGTIEDQKEKINEQEEKITKQQNDIKTLMDQLNTLTHRVEELEKEK